MQTGYGTDVRYFLWAILSGIVLAALYDVFRAVRRVSNVSVLRINAEDTFFLTIAAVAVFCIAYTKNDGRLRFYGGFGTVCGFLGFRRIAGDWPVRAIAKGAGLAVKVVLCVLRFVLLPARLVCGLLSRPLIIMGWYVSEKISKAEGVARVRKKRKNISEKLARARKTRGSDFYN